MIFRNMLKWKGIYTATDPYLILCIFISVSTQAVIKTRISVKLMIE